MGGINQAAWWIVTVRLMVQERCVLRADDFAGKPAPTGIVVASDVGQYTDTVGAGLPAMGPSKRFEAYCAVVGPGGAESASAFSPPLRNRFSRFSLLPILGLQKGFHISNQ